PSSSESRALHSLPPRRSSDLSRRISGARGVLYRIEHAADRSCKGLFRIGTESNGTLGALCTSTQTRRRHALWKASRRPLDPSGADRKSTRLNSSHVKISYAVF